MTNFAYPILYTFRRCPFAMRARFVLRYTSTFVELREIKLQNKPKEFLNVSKKGTVPVLILSRDDVIDESLDIINWCLKKTKYNDLEDVEDKIWKIIKNLDNTFKINLDRYKYPSRFNNCDGTIWRDKNIEFLINLNKILEKSKFLHLNKISFVDFIIFPFIRQFRNVNVSWFENLNLCFLNKWFSNIANSKAFDDIMRKYKVWQPEDKPIITNFNYN